MNAIQRRLTVIRLIDELGEKTENGAVLRDRNGDVILEVKMVERNKEES